MMSEPHHPYTSAQESSSSLGNDGNEAADFECNICFELAQDPVITLCGHLYCWPCLYRWLRGHSHSHECPVCKALVEEEKVIPLYGRGKTPTDPRTKPVPGVEIPNRPPGQRPETAPLSGNNLGDVIMGLMGGFVPMTFSDFGVSARFGGVFFPFFGVQLHGFSNASGRGGPSGQRRGYTGLFRDGDGQFGRDANQGDDETLKHIFCIVLFFVVFAFLSM